MTPRPEPPFKKSYCVLRGDELVGTYDWLAEALEARGEGCQVFERLTRSVGTAIKHSDDMLAALKRLIQDGINVGTLGQAARVIAAVEQHNKEMAEACEIV